MRQWEVEVMYIETQWDHEVDVVCIGAEGGVLAAGLVAANADCDLYLGITEPTAPHGDLASALGYRGVDGQTTKHLAGFEYAFTDADRERTRWPVRAVEDAAPARSGRRGAVEPFFGAALEQWAHRCGAAPNALVYNRVTKRQMTALRSTARGEKIEAAVVGSIELTPGRPAVSVGGWLRDEASAAGLLPDTDVRLVKLVFEDGVAGALVETRDGVQAVRARENLIIAVGDAAMSSRQPLISATEPMTVDLCVVSKAASRFGELEIVTATGDDDHLLFVDAPEAELQMASGL